MKSNLLRKGLCTAAFVLLLGGGLTGCDIPVIGGSADKAYDAYKEFYREFYDEHCESGEWAMADCGGQILLNENNEPLLAISDVSIFDESDDDAYGVCVDIYIYEYKHGKVKELARKTGLMPSDDGWYIASMNGTITMKMDDFESGDTIIYVLDEDGFKKEIEGTEEMEAILGIEDTESSEANIEEASGGEKEKYLYFWSIAGGSSELYTALCSEDEYIRSGVCAINGSDFEMLLSRLADVKPKTQLELKLAYTDFFTEERICEDAYCTFLDGEQIYAYDSAEDKYYYLRTLGKTAAESDFLERKDEINGTEVELSGSFLTEYAIQVTLDDIDEIKDEDGTITVKTNDDLTLTGSDTYNMEEIMGIATAESIDSATETYNDEEWEFYWGIRIGDSDSSNGATYEQVKKYLDKGLATDIRINCLTDRYMDSSKAGFKWQMTGIVITLPDIDTYASLLEGEEKEKFIIENEVLPAYENYVEENLGTSNTFYSMVYIDDDNVPELLCDESGNGFSTTILCYKDGTVYESDVWIHYNFSYVPKGNKVSYGGWGTGASETNSVAHLENGVLVVEHNCQGSNRDLEGMDMTTEELLENYGVAPEYEIDGVSCSREDYDNFINQYFNIDNAVNGWSQYYDSIQEAYENIGKYAYSAYSMYITKFELADNVLTIETEEDYGNNISYPVSEDCTWEEASVGDPDPEFYGTTSYEEMKEMIEEVRQVYVQEQSYDSPPGIYVDMEGDVIVRVYVLRS